MGTTVIDMLNFIKITNMFYKRPCQEHEKTSNLAREKVFAKDIFGKGLLSIKYTELLKLNSKKTT